MSRVDLRSKVIPCVYQANIACALPAACGGVPKECRRCGWNPEVDEQRKWERKTLGRIVTLPRKAEETSSVACGDTFPRGEGMKERREGRR